MATAHVRGGQSLADFAEGTIVSDPAQVQAPVQALADAGSDYVII